MTQINRSNRIRAARLGVVGLTVLAGLQLGSGSAVGAPICNTTPIQVDIPPEPMQEVRRALPYPSTIDVGTLGGTITDVDVSLIDVTHPYPEDLDLLLVAPDGTSLLLMSDVGGNNAFAHNTENVDLTLSDEAAAALPADATLVSGTYRPTDDDGDTMEEDEFDVTDTFPSTAPAPGPATALSVFDTRPASGVWRLYVIDDNPGPPMPAPQGILGGWCIDITTTATPSTSSSTPTSSTTPTSSSSSTTPTTSSTTSSSTSTSTSSTSTSSTSTSTTSTSTSTTSTSTTVPTTTSSSTSTSSTSTSSTSSTLPPATICDALPAATIQAQPGVPTMGTAGDDVIYGTPGIDRIVGLGGNDVIVGFGGDDQISGGDGNDAVCAGDGNDQVTGDAGNDLLVGDAGNDVLSGAAGDDRLIGGAGIDRLTGGANVDTCNAGGQAGDFSAPPPDCDSVT